MLEQQNKRTKQIIIRVTEEEYIQLLHNSTHPRLATWIRETCLNEKSSSKQYCRVDKNLISWLGRLNGNLNQIAKYINVQNTIQNRIDIVKILSELALIRSNLDNLLEAQYADKDLQK